jgi:hypothetical protein
MNDLDHYLGSYFMRREQLAAACGCPSEELTGLIRDRLIPAPSYVVSQAHISSHVFGRLPAAGATEGEYFHPASKVWVGASRQVIEEVGRRGAYQELRRRFSVEMQRALRELNLSIWRLRDSFADDGAVIVEGLAVRVDSMWEHFLWGTFGLCVVNPASVAEIARKEVLQEKLTTLSENGTKQHFTVDERPVLLELIDAYSRAAMPFSPAEYPMCSRKRLVDDLLGHLAASP